MKNLGRGVITQKTINEIVNKKDIEFFLFENIDKIENILKKKPDKFGNEIFNYLKKQKKLIFELNKHEE